MRFSELQWKAFQIFAQKSVIIAAMLFLQSLLGGCVSADNGASVTVDKQTEINIPVTIPEIEVSK